MKKRAKPLDWWVINAIFDMITFEPKNRLVFLREVANSGLGATKYQALNLLKKWVEKGEIKTINTFDDGRLVYYYKPSSRKVYGLNITGVEL